MSVLTLLGYPGLQVFGAFRLNLYTAGGLFSLCCYGAALLLILLFFDGTLRHEPSVAEPRAKGDDDSKDALLLRNRPNEGGGDKFDRLAVFICCLTRMGMALVMVYSTTVSGPNMMTMFGWRGEELVFYQSLMHAAVGLFGVLFSLLYVLRLAQGRLSERKAIVFSLSVVLLFFLVTFPGPWHGASIPYEQLAPANSSAAPLVLRAGCRASRAWCASTPAVNVWLFCGSAVLCLGLGVPLLHLNLEILYSKVLGNIKQGTMQAVFLACGEALTVLGPVVFR